MPRTAVLCPEIKQDAVFTAVAADVVDESSWTLSRGTTTLGNPLPMLIRSMSGCGPAGNCNTGGLGCNSGGAGSSVSVSRGGDPLAGRAGVCDAERL